MLACHTHATALILIVVVSRTNDIIMLQVAWAFPLLAHVTVLDSSTISYDSPRQLVLLLTCIVAAFGACVARFLLCDSQFQRQLPLGT